MSKEGDLFLQHLYGWSDGAAARAMNPARMNHPNTEMRDAYNAGYTEGYQDKKTVAKRLSEKYGYTPNVLRACA